MVIFSKSVALMATNSYCILDDGWCILDTNIDRKLKGEISHNNGWSVGNRAHHGY